MHRHTGERFVRGRDGLTRGPGGGTAQKRGCFALSCPCPVLPFSSPTSYPHLFIKICLVCPWISAWETSTTCMRLSLRFSWQHWGNPKFNGHSFLYPEPSLSSMPGSGPGWRCRIVWVTSTQLLPTGPSPWGPGRSHFIWSSVFLGAFCVTHWTLSFSMAWCCPLAWKHMTAPIHTWRSPGDKGIALLVVLPYMQNFFIPRSLNKLCPQVSLAQRRTQFHFWASSRDWEILWDDWHRLDFLKNKHFFSQPKKPELASKSQIHFQTSARAFSQLILHHSVFFPHPLTSSLPQHHLEVGCLKRIHHEGKEVRVYDSWVIDFLLLEFRNFSFPFHLDFTLKAVGCHQTFLNRRWYLGSHLYSND